MQYLEGTEWPREPVNRGARALSPGYGAAEGMMDQPRELGCAASPHRSARRADGVIK